MSDIKIAIITGVTGLAATIAAWILGGKQNLANSTQDAITKGTDQIVETSTKLLTTLEKMVDDERSHRQTCETKLAELKQEIEILKKQFNDIQNSSTGFSLN
jgi:polyhydroxyalkanoate synthesis regulator phasin